MSEVEIKEGNKLIAEFMGWEKTDPDRNYGLSQWVIPREFRTVYGPGNAEPFQLLTDKSLVFHSSWEWLMPVVAKLNDDDIWETVDIKDLAIMLVSADLEAAYQEVVSMIKLINDVKS